MNSRDEQDSSTSDDDRDWIESELAELQEDGLAKKRISAVQKDEMLKIQDRVGYGSVLDLLSEHFPDILTAKGKKQKDEEERGDRESRQTGEFAPSITVEGVGQRPDNEPAATSKQIAYLRDLGVRDDALLGRLGKFQASALIDKVLDARNKGSNTPPKSSGCLGVLMFGFLLGGGLAWVVFW